MPEAPLSPQDVRLMQGLAQQVTALRPELVNSDATVGELAWGWGKDHADLGSTWRPRLWFSGGDLAGWGWAFLPYKVMRTDGRLNEVSTAGLTWQVHPDWPELLDGILDWYDTEAARADRRATVAGPRTRTRGAGWPPTATGSTRGPRATTATGSRSTAAAVRDLEEPVLPAGYRFRTAEQVRPEEAAQAHLDAWHPSSFTDRGIRGGSEIWPYRRGLHVLVRAPDGTMASTAVIWLDEHNGTAEFEPVGTHQGYRRKGLGSSLLRHGMQRAARRGPPGCSSAATPPRRARSPGRCTTASGSARSPATSPTSSRRDSDPDLAAFPAVDDGRDSSARTRACSGWPNHRR